MKRRFRMGARFAVLIITPALHAPCAAPGRAWRDQKIENPHHARLPASARATCSIRGSARRRNRRDRRCRRPPPARMRCKLPPWRSCRVGSPSASGCSCRRRAPKYSPPCGNCRTTDRRTGRGICRRPWRSATGDSRPAPPPAVEAVDEQEPAKPLLPIKPPRPILTFDQRAIEIEARQHRLPALRSSPPRKGRCAPAPPGYRGLSSRGSSPGGRRPRPRKSSSGTHVAAARHRLYQKRDRPHGFTRFICYAPPGTVRAECPQSGRRAWKNSWGY